MTRSDRASGPVAPAPPSGSRRTECNLPRPRSASRSPGVGVGYGTDAFGDRFTATPEVGFGRSNDSREYGLGWRLTPSGGDRSSFELRLDATRREAAAAAEPDHGLKLRLNARW